jgi:hypothetical protein
MSKELIARFLQEMRERHQEEIDAIYLPEGTVEYLRERVQEGDIETLTFMLKLSYLMGLQTGYAVHESEDAGSAPTTPRGPLQA